MPEWNDPKSDYVASDQVTPGIFNELAENEKYLKAYSLQVQKRPTTGSDVHISSIVLVEVT